MIIYNITFQVEWSIYEAWLAWMRETYIPSMLSITAFSQPQILRLLEIEESAGPTLAVQFHAPSVSAYDDYLQLHAPALNRVLREKWGSRVVFFGTAMEVV